MEDFIDELTRQLECGFDGMRFNRDWVYEIINDALAKTGVCLTLLETDAAITPAGAPEVETGGYMIEQWVNDNLWRAKYGPFETLEKAREVRERSKITPTRIVLQQKVVIEQ